MQCFAREFSGGPSPVIESRGAWRKSLVEEQ